MEEFLSNFGVNSFCKDDADLIRHNLTLQLYMFVLFLYVDMCVCICMLLKIHCPQHILP